MVKMLAIPWLRRNFLARRRLDRIFLDTPDAIYRFLTGRRHWPPYSLRAFVGGSDDFAGAGQWFLDDLERLKLLGPGSRILDIGCGCGRVAYGVAASDRLKEWAVSYVGMDVDEECVRWCTQNISAVNKEFRFYHVDAFNPSYNPAGSAKTEQVSFPHPGESFDLILATSVFTHLLPADLERYLAEAARMLAPAGVLYASFFLLKETESEDRHPAAFGSRFGHYAVNRTDFPANAVAYDEGYILDLTARLGLETWGPIRYGSQDVVLLMKPPSPCNIELAEGWHDLELGCWRWTEPTFRVVAMKSWAGKAVLRFKFTIPSSLFEKGGGLTVSAVILGSALPERNYTSSGEHVYLADFATESCADVGIEFRVSRFMQAGLDQRKLGLQVLFATDCDHGRRSLSPILVLQHNQ